MTTVRKTPTQRSTPASRGAVQHALSLHPSKTPKPSAMHAKAKRKALVLAAVVKRPREASAEHTVEVLPHIKHAVLVSQIKASAAGFRAAVNMEIAVACAVFIETGSTGLAAKKELISVYADAGYDCKVGGDGNDYKSVSRRINYSSQFFDSQPKNSLEAAMGEARDDAAIQTLVAHIAAKFNFRSMQDVLTVAGVAQPTRHTSRTPARGKTTGPDAGDKGVMAAIKEVSATRQAEAPHMRDTDDEEKWAKIVFDGATLLLPSDMDVGLLGDLGLKLAHAAQQMRGDKIDVATLEAEFSQELETH